MTPIGNFSISPQIQMASSTQTNLRPMLRFAGETPAPDNLGNNSRPEKKKRGLFKRILIAALIGTNMVSLTNFWVNLNKNQKQDKEFVAVKKASKAQEEAFNQFKAEDKRGDSTLTNKLKELNGTVTQFQAENKESDKILKNKLAELRGSVHSVAIMNRVARAGVRIEGRESLGSGTFFKDDKGNLYILTNSHVVEKNAINNDDTNHPRFKVRLYNGSDLQPEIEVEAELVKLPNGKFIESPWAVGKDLAVLKVVEQPQFKPPHCLTASDFRDLKKEPLKVGEPVFLVGTPLGLPDAVSPGFISHIERKLWEESDLISIQTNAPSNPGNSGGALYDAKGRFIGVPNSGAHGWDGVNFGIRLDTVLSFLKENGIIVTPGKR